MSQNMGADMCHYMFIIHQIYDDVFGQMVFKTDPSKDAFDQSVQYIVKLYNDKFIDNEDLHTLIYYIEDMIAIYEDGYFYDYGNKSGIDTR